MFTIPGKAFFSLTLGPSVSSMQKKVFLERLKSLCDVKSKAQVQAEKKEENIQQKMELKVEKVEKEENKENKNAGLLGSLTYTIQYGSSALAGGIKSGGTFLRTQIEKGGEYLKEKGYIKKGEKGIEVDPTLKQVVEGASKYLSTNILFFFWILITEFFYIRITPYALVFTEGLVQGLKVVGGYIVEKVGEELEKSESLKAYVDTNSENYKCGKELALTSISAIATVWDSLVFASTEVARGVGNSTSLVVEEKYGKEAGDTTRKGIQSGIDVVSTVYSLDNIIWKSIASQPNSNSNQKKDQK